MFSKLNEKKTGRKRVKRRRFVTSSLLIFFSLRLTHFGPVSACLSRFFSSRTHRARIFVGKGHLCAFLFEHYSLLLR